MEKLSLMVMQLTLLHNHTSNKMFSLNGNDSVRPNSKLSVHAIVTIIIW